MLCPACGNILQDDRCSRCEANSFARQRRWRTGDKGGRRPERQQVKRSFEDALDGIWRNSRHDVFICIDSENGRYHSQHGNRSMTHHDFQMGEDTDVQFTFYKDALLVEIGVSDMGFLIMSAKNKKMAFAYEFDEELFRICPHCFAKSPLHYEICRECKWEFEPFEK